MSKTPTNIKPQAQEGTLDNRPPHLEDAPVHKSIPWPTAGKISRNLFGERKDWLLLPNYLNNDNKDMTSVTSPKPPIREELRQKNNQLPAQEQTNVDGGQIVPSAKIKNRKKIGMAITKNNCNSKCLPNKGFRCPKQGTPRL